MNTSRRELPIAERITLVEDIWDSTAIDGRALPVSSDQRIELARRLERYKLDHDRRHLAEKVLSGIRHSLRR